MLSQTFLDSRNPQFSYENLYFKLTFNSEELFIVLTSIHYPNLHNNENNPEVEYDEHCLRQGKVKGHDFSSTILDICNTMVIYILI